MQNKNHFFTAPGSEIPIRIISLSNLEPICQDTEKPLSFVQIGKLSYECNFECPPLERAFLTGEKHLGKREKRIIRRWRTQHKAYQIRRRTTAQIKKIVNL